MRRDKLRNLFTIIPAFLILVSQTPAEAKPGKKYPSQPRRSNIFCPKSRDKRILENLNFWEAWNWIPAARTLAAFLASDLSIRTERFYQ